MNIKTLIALLPTSAPMPSDMMPNEQDRPTSAIVKSNIDEQDEQKEKPSEESLAKIVKYTKITSIAMIPLGIFGTLATIIICFALVDGYTRSEAQT